MSGYAHPRYASSFSEFAAPLHLPRCNGWLLRRSIAGSPYYDAMGCYPLFCCNDWTMLGADLDNIGSEFVSLVLVTDPFASIDETALPSCFDRVVQYKNHYVAELDRPADEIIRKSHLAAVRRAIRYVDVAVCEQPREYLDQWVELFANLVRRHNITGMRAFSREAFAEQLAVPGMVMFEARAQGKLVGLDLWYVQGDVAYGHLVAFSELGYRLRASYATKWHLMQHFHGKVRWIDFGGAAGSREDPRGGLAAFKRGWSSGVRPVHLCTRTFQPKVYDELVRTRQLAPTSHFPAYRAGEVS